LSENEFGTCVDFLFKPLDFLLTSFVGVGGFRVTLRETSDGDTEISGIVGMNMFD
jgi:hypothetical protein